MARGGVDGRVEARMFGLSCVPCSPLAASAGDLGVEAAACRSWSSDEASTSEEPGSVVLGVSFASLQEVEVLPLVRATGNRDWVAQKGLSGVLAVEVPKSQARPAEDCVGSDQVGSSTRP